MTLKNTESSMPNPLTLNFNNLSQLAQVGSGNIVVRNGGLQTTGKVGAFFTAKAAHRAAGEALLQGVRQRYGDTVADALAPELRTVREQGKPLSARTARDVLAKASEMSEGLVRINTDMARHFILGNASQGDTRNLDAALEAFCAARGLDPAARHSLKDAFGEAVLGAARNSSTLLSFAEMGEAVRSASLPGMKKAVSVLAAEQFMANADPACGADAAMDAFAGSLGLDADQREKLRPLVGMAVRHAVENAEGELTAQTLFGSVSAGSLPGMTNFAYACGKARLNDAVARDTMAWATPDTMADAAMVTAQFARGGGISLNALVMQRLPVMRELQPEGLLSHETLWQGCFREPMPEELKNAAPRQFNDAMFERMLNLFQEAAPGNPMAKTDGMGTLMTGISLEKTLESLHGHVALTFADFVNLPTLTPLSRLGSLAEVEASLARDINRRGTHNSLPGYSPTISFGAAGGGSETVHIRDTSAMSEEDRASFAGGKPSPMSHDLAARALRLCDGNEVQARQIIQSMGQAGAFLVRLNSSITGVFETEHSPLDIDVRKEENGDITMRFYKPEQSPLDIDYTYTITPDGQGRLTACRIQARQPAGSQPA